MFLFLFNIIRGQTISTVSPTVVSEKNHIAGYQRKEKDPIAAAAESYIYLDSLVSALKRTA